jgi:protein TonB
MGQESWLSAFAAQIRRAATYPAGSNGSGTAQVSVTVARNGRLVSHRLTSSSGSPVLDHAAMAAIERAQPFPPFPASMPEAQITRTVPLHMRPQ